MQRACSLLLVNTCFLKQQDWVSVRSPAWPRSVGSGSPGTEPSALRPEWFTEDARLGSGPNLSAQGGPDTQGVGGLLPQGPRMDLVQATSPAAARAGNRPGSR